MERSYKIGMAVFMVFYFAVQLALETVSAFGPPSLSGPVGTFLGCFFAAGLLAITVVSIVFFVRLQRMLESMTRKQRTPISKVLYYSTHML